MLLEKIIRLAHEVPETRIYLVPLIRWAKDFGTPEALEKYLKEHPDADKTKHKVKKPTLKWMPVKPKTEEKSTKPKAEPKPPKSKEPSVEESLAKAKALPADSRGELKNPIPLANTGKTNKEIRNFVQDHEDDDVPVQKINLKDLKSAQDIVTKDSVLEMMEKYDESRAGAVMVARIKGQLVLLDGNHRAATAKLLGKATIKAKVFDWS